MAEERTLRKIIFENKKLLGNCKDIEKIEDGFTNFVYSCNNYILKICFDKSNEEKFNNEIDFYTKNQKNNYIPKLYTFHKAINKDDLSYLILEKLNGKSLYYKWHTLNDETRKKNILEISNLMKNFHLNKGRKYDWNKFISDRIKISLKTCYVNGDLDKILFKKMQNILKKSFKYLDSSEFSLVHSDIHFDNIIITDNNEIKIIDFETTLFAPIDYELNIFLRMCRQPSKYANEDMESYVKIEDYNKIEFWMKEFYPEIFSCQYFDIRMRYYDLEIDLELLTKFKGDKELKEVIVKEIEELEKLI